VEDVPAVAAGSHERPMDALDAAVATDVLSQPSPARDTVFEVAAVEDAARLGYPGGMLAGLVDENRMHGERRRSRCRPLLVDQLDDAGLVSGQVVGRHYRGRRDQQGGDDDDP